MSIDGSTTKTKNLSSVNKPTMKKDAMALVTGQPVYMDDVIDQNCLLVKVLRSPHANAIVKSVNTDIAKKVPGIEGIYTYEDVPDKRFTFAGQTYPEMSPYDRLILDKHVRYVGDPVAIVAGVDEKSVNKALKLIKIEYEVLEPILDFRNAKDSDIIVHPEDNWKALCQVGADNKRNLCATGGESNNDVDKVMSECDIVMEHTYHTKANQQSMMETFRTYCSIDAYGRLNILSSTQIVYHIRRIVANALDIPKSKIRVSKPRIGGGFGAKQTAVAEVFPAFVTWMTKKPSKMIMTREESLIASTPRHEMEITVKIGAMRDGRIRALDVYSLSNTGAYGEHGPTTVGLSGQKSISLYGSIEAHRFRYDVVYTNVMSAGAYRGYGATQGIFAVESMVNELARKLSMDPVAIREMNMVKEGQIMPSYHFEPNTSCTLDKCMARAKEMFNWEEKSKVRDMGNGKVRSAGVAMAMQSSGISGVDVGSATISLNDEGFYILSIAAADMGTGCDTILAQIAAEVLECSVDNIIVLGADTDASPYDSGSYASSTTYVTGKAVEKAAMKLKDIIIEKASQMLGIEAGANELNFDGEKVTCDKRSVSLMDIATSSMCGNNQALLVTESNSSPVSPPPFMVGMAEIELDKDTGKVDLIDYVAVVDCGTPINPNLARVQVEGGLVQGIGMALFEDINYSSDGKITENSFMQYKIPTRLDMGTLRVEFESSYENSGPFGAKSIGEVVINTPSPAIAGALLNITGTPFRELPITPEKIVMSTM